MGGLAELSNNPLVVRRVGGAIIALLAFGAALSILQGWNPSVAVQMKIDVPVESATECVCPGLDQQNKTKDGKTTKPETASGAAPNTTEASEPAPNTLDANHIIKLGIHQDTVEGWKIRRMNHLEQYHKQINMPDSTGRGPWSGSRAEGNAYFQDNWEPTFSCPYERRLGHWGDGGKWICNPHVIKRPAIVYSLGSNNDFSFEEAMHEYFAGQVELHTFDFGTPVGKPDFVNYHQYFISAEDKNNTGGPVHKTVKTIMKELGHSHVDIFKIDIEGHEMDVLLPVLENNGFPNVDQMQIELHVKPGSFKPTPDQVDRFFKLLSEKEQMEIFHKEPNIKFGGGIACEYSLVKVDWKALLPQIHLS
eukprot:comp8254_c0_seq1/m.3679 comp8254_c0_seq1/g.3679  ORF comp8254_c0_seq1/g.3679 comp8254_c0_seq1/m.3679 type:complete len:363 (-) comp8254_c0_seq1:438-1526(-)